MLSINRFFHPFEVNDLREMVSIMTIITTQAIGEVGMKSVVVLSLVFFVIAPLRVLGPLILVPPF
jgi:hypothetical protein